LGMEWLVVALGKALGKELGMALGKESGMALA